MSKMFHVIIEQDEDGVYIGKVPELRGCLSQGDTLDELMENIKEAIELYLEIKPELREQSSEFVGIQRLWI